jgi:hypothetical protein
MSAIFVKIEIPADLEGGLVHTRTALRLSDQQIAEQATVYALRCVIGSIPLEGDLLKSLENGHLVNRALRERLSHALLFTEKCLADTAAATATLTAVIGGEAKSNGHAPEGKT